MLLSRPVCDERGSVVKKYRIIFLGLLEGMQVFKDRMSALGVPSSTVDEILQKAPVVLKAELSLADARQYAEAVQLAGGRVSIREQGLFEEPERHHKSIDIKPFEYFTMCPECGYKQPKREACVKCGHLFPRDANGTA